MAGRRSRFDAWEAYLALPEEEKQRITEELEESSAFGARFFAQRSSTMANTRPRRSTTGTAQSTEPPTFIRGPRPAQAATEPSAPATLAEEETPLEEPPAEEPEAPGAEPPKRKSRNTGKQPAKKQKTGEEPYKTPEKKARATRGAGKSKASTAKASTAPVSLSDNVAAMHLQYRADLDHALAHGQQQVQQAQTVAYQTTATLVGRAITYFDLATFELTARLEANGTLAPGQTIPLFPVPTPAPLLPLPAPYKSLWLSGKTLKGPLQATNPEEAVGALESDMLEGEPVIPSEDDGDDDDD
ncbi:hypothetical protein C8R44DRAFT_851095 [Mycena epipterygia]|nr:hypothetical protein C8R44DRAFT_851095 [Mycena epipterygia]